MQKIFFPQSEPEANAIKAFLEENDIPALVRTYQDSVYDGLFQAQNGWGVIEVDDNNAEKARKLLEEW